MKERQQMRGKESTPKIERISQGKLKIYSGFVQGYQVTRLVDASKMVATLRRIPAAVNSVDTDVVVYTDGTTTIVGKKNGPWVIDTEVVRAGLPVRYQFPTMDGTTDHKLLREFLKLVSIPKLDWKLTGDKSVLLTFSDKQTLDLLGSTSSKMSFLVMPSEAGLSSPDTQVEDEWIVVATPARDLKLILVEFYYSDRFRSVLWKRAYRAPRWGSLCNLLGVHDGD